MWISFKMQVEGIPNFILAEGVDGTGVSTKILSCNISMRLWVDNKSKLFGLHVQPPLNHLYFGRLPLAITRHVSIPCLSSTRVDLIWNMCVANVIKLRRVGSYMRGAVGWHRSGCTWGRGTRRCTGQGGACKTCWREAREAWLWGLGWDWGRAFTWWRDWCTSGSITKPTAWCCCPKLTTP